MEKVSCDICGRKFKTNEALNQHKNDAHKQAVSVAIEKARISKGKILAILIPVLIVGLIVYGIFWALTTEGIGIPGSTHIHADFAIFLDGKQITPLPSQYFERSNYMYVEGGPGEGTVLHMHATNVPLKIFFDSIGVRFNSKCFETTAGEKYCNIGDITLKMYVKHANGTWQQNFEYDKYIFEDLNKILITYGNESEEQIQLQQNNVTDFAKVNTERDNAARR